VNKTSAAYTKPVNTIVGQCINAWETARPKEQPSSLDKKTGEAVQFLFFYRGRRMAKTYINKYLIPILCKKAGVPEHDSRGSITSHRARATIASMLYNAKEPLNILQLKEYLGHKRLSSTQHYLKVDPTKLASQVAKAGYLEQNMATIEVLLDQDAVRSGAAARGEPWKYYDLGHGYCLNDFWAECKHRMACARCPFYRPKESIAEQLLEGQANLLRMLEFVQLTEEEKLLVTEGIDLQQALIEQLADTPTPAGPTPRELAASRQDETKIIPLESIGRTTTTIEHSSHQSSSEGKKQHARRSQDKEEKHSNVSEGG
jgi:Phage integrase family